MALVLPKKLAANILITYNNIEHHVHVAVSADFSGRRVLMECENFISIF